MALWSLSLATTNGFAQDAPARAASTDDEGVPGEPKPETKKPEYLPDASIATSLPYLADPGGLRGALFDKGIKFNLIYIGEFFSNFTGGKRPGAIGEGRLQLLVDVDLEKMVGWKGGTIHLDGQQIHGEGLSRYFVGTINTTSGIEALTSTRLYEAYFEQQLIEGKLSVRAGQLAADSQYLISSYSSMFINSTFGFSLGVANNLPAGGPVFPLATPGAGLKFTPTDGFTVLATVYNGDPADPRAADPQKANRNGVDFRLQDPATIFAEGQYKYNNGKNAPRLPGIVKVGGYTNLSRFPHGLFAPQGDLSGRRYGQGIYGVLDQQIYRLSADAPDKGVGLFVRGSVIPNDASVLNFFMDGGLNFSGLIAARPDDSFGVAFSYLRFSKAARDQDLFSSVLTPGFPIRDYEATIEVTYQAQVVPGFTLQPDFQYAIHPGGNIPNPRDPLGRPIKDAVIFGLRAALSY